MPPVGFELTILAGKRPKIDALDRAATGTGGAAYYNEKFKTDVPKKLDNLTFTYN